MGYKNKEDQKEYWEKWYEKNKESVLKRMKEYNSKEENKLKKQKRYANLHFRYVDIKGRSRKNNIEFNLTEEYLESIYPADGICPLLNIALDWDSPPRHDSTPSLDRIDNNKGYIKGNVQWVSWRANRLMSNMQPDEILMLAQNYKKIYDKVQLS